VLGPKARARPEHPSIPLSIGLDIRGQSGAPTHGDFPWERDQRKLGDRRRRTEAPAERGDPRRPQRMNAALAEARRLQKDDLSRTVTSVPPPPAA
jgi:hypothetical protein